MKDLETINPLLTPEERSMRFVVKIVAIVVVIVVVTMGGCSIHGHVYEADNLAAEAKIKAMGVEVVKAEANVEIEKIKSMERMIKQGANPIAIRCMDKGFGNDNDVCLAVGVATGRISSSDVN